MQSKTSFFNKAVFLNTLKRFWPMWLIYLGVWCLNLPMNVFSMTRYGEDALNMKRHILNAGSEEAMVMALIWAVLAAMAVWSFVYNSRSMSGIASLPLRRENVFFSVLLAGLLPALAVFFVSCALAAVIAAVGGYNMLLPCLQLFCAASMQYIFFYGFATLCAQLTGNIIVLPVVYLVLNYTAWAVETLVGGLMDLLVYGLPAPSMGISLLLSPALLLFECGPKNVTGYLPQYDEYQTIDVVYDGWGALIVYAVVGLLLMAGALALYRRRRMESAGDVVAINALKPVFKYCMTFGCALVAGMLLYMILLDPLALQPRAEAVGIGLFMLVGAFVGYFAAQMLIEKSFRVFRGHWRGMGISALVLVLLLACVEMDVFGLERRVPDADELKYVCVSAGDAVDFEERENIERAIEIHKSIIEGKRGYESRGGRSEPYSHTGSEYVCFTYVLKNGRSIQREYSLPYNFDREETLADLYDLQELQNTQEAISNRKALGFELEEDTITGGYVNCWLTAEQLEELGESMDKETFILINYYGFDPDYVEKHMTAAEKQQMMDDYYAANGSMDIRMDAWYRFEFSAEEMYELYTQCILPDMADSSIGRIWILSDEDYYSNVYAASINIEMRYEYKLTDPDVRPAYPTAEVGPGMPYTGSYNFSTTPLTISTRTLAWLFEHGVVLNTEALHHELSGDGYYIKDAYIE